MICPICNKGELKEEISLKGFFMKRKEIITYCPICEFKKVRTIKISKDDLQRVKSEIEYQKEIELQKAINTKEKREIKDTKFNQRYERI